MSHPPSEALPPGCRLRAATAADLPAIRALVRGARLDPTQLRWPQFQVVCCGDAVVACGQLRRFRGAQELGSLVVAPAWRGRGLAVVLVARLVAAAQGAPYLECQGALAPFYHRLGFVPVRWRALPRGLKLKFGLSRLVTRLLGQPLALMVYRGTVPAPERNA